MWKKKDSSLVCLAAPQRSSNLLVIPSSHLFSIASGRLEVKEKSDFILHPSAVDEMSLYSDVLVIGNFTRSPTRIEVSCFEEVRKSLLKLTDASVSIILFTGAGCPLQNGLRMYSGECCVESVSFYSPDKENDTLDAYSLPDTAIGVVIGNPKSGKSSLASMISRENDCVLLSNPREIANVPNSRAILDYNFTTSAERNQFLTSLLKRGRVVVVFWIVRDGRIFNQELPPTEQVSSASYNSYSSRFVSPPSGCDIRVIP
jgi:hypothetical protein